MPHLEEGIALGSKQKRQWWVDENNDENNDDKEQLKTLQTSLLT